MTIPAPTLNHPPHFVYTKATWAAAWVEDRHLYCITSNDRSGPQHAQATLTYRYGRQVRPKRSTFNRDTAPFNVPRPNLLGLYVRVVIPSLNLTWTGIITDIDDNRKGDHENGPSPTGQITVTAYGLTLLLEKSFPIQKSFVVKSGNAILVDTAIPFNGGTDGRAGRDRVASANFDDTEKAFSDFGPGVIPSYWTAKDAADYLLTRFPPRDVGGTARVPFQLVDNGALSFELEPFDYDNQTLWQLLNRLIPRQRGLGFNATVNAAGTVSLNVWSQSPTQITLPSGPPHIAANTNNGSLNFSTSNNIIRAVVSDSAIDTYDQVIVEGEPLGVVFTLAPDENLDRDWTTAERDDYNTAISTSDTAQGAADNADFRARDEFHHVYSSWSLAANWDGQAFTHSTGATDENAVYLRQPNGDVDFTTLAAFWQPALRFADFVPLRSQVDYGPAPDPADDNSDARNDYLAPFVVVGIPPTSGGNPTRWVYGERLDAAATSELESRNHTWTIQTRIQTDNAGFHLEVIGGQQHYFASDDFVPVFSKENIPTGQGIKLADWRVTAYMPLQQRVLARMPATPASGDVARTKTFRVAGMYHDYLVPGTVIGIDENGALQEATGGVLRDDTDQLKNIATILWAWYGIDRKILDLSFRGISNTFAVGQLITSLATPTGNTSIQTPITFIELDLAEGTTSIKTSFDDIEFESLLT